MNNEPLAWYNADDSSLSFKNHGGGWQPLYTHPAKTLTDEEIISLINKHIDYVPDGDGMKVVGVMDFAKAILRKAQEK